MYSDVVIIIPSRLDSVRLPQKALKKIGDLTMIEHVWRQINQTGLPNIYVATDSLLIAEIIHKAGGKCIMTNSNCQTGTDRVYEALNKLPSHQSFNYIVNVQGDMPFVDPETIINVIDTLKASKYDIITPVTKVNQDIANLVSTVKVIADGKHQALYFSRHPIPHGAEEFLYHVGIYGFRRKGLKRFIKAKSSPSEEIEKIEALRALHHGIKIGICYIDHIPLSVDTDHDLTLAIKFHLQNALIT